MVAVSAIRKREPKFFQVTAKREPKFFHVTVPSAVVPPTVVFQVGAVAPVVPATVACSMLLFESYTSSPTAYVPAAHAGAVGLMPSMVVPPTVVFQIGAEAPVVPATVHCSTLLFESNTWSPTT